MWALSQLAADAVGLDGAQGKGSHDCVVLAILRGEPEPSWG